MRHEEYMKQAAIQSDALEQAGKDLQKAQWYLNTLLEDVVASDES